MTSEGNQHMFITCDGCQSANFTGVRYRCRDCPDYDLCEYCQNRLTSSSSASHPFPLGTHRVDHSMERIDRPRGPTDDPSTRILELLLGLSPGDPDVAALLLRMLAGGGPKKPVTKQSVIDDLQVVTATLPLINALDHQACSICLSDFLVGEQLTQLPCGHHFHMPSGPMGEDDCGGIVPWLKQCNECPMCRFKLEAEPGSTRSSDMSQPWTCPGCDATNPGDEDAGRNARCACGVNRNVCVLLANSGHLRDVLAACEAIYRRIVSIPSGTNCNERSGILHDIEALESSSSLASMESQNWDIGGHIVGLLRALLKGDDHFPILMLCQNSRAVVRYIHIYLDALHLSEFSFHTRPSSTASAEELYPPGYQTCFPVLDTTKSFLSDNFYLFDEIAMLAVAGPSPDQWTRMCSTFLPGFEKNNWALTVPMQQLGHGERDLPILVSGLGMDIGTIAVVECLLVRVLSLERKALPTKDHVCNPILDVLCEVVRTGSVEGPWECPGCDANVGARDQECTACHVKRSVMQRAMSRDVAALTEELKRVYVEALSYRTKTSISPDDAMRRNVEASINALDADAHLMRLEEAGWELRAHFISMFQCIISGGAQYPIYGLDRNSRALIRTIHRKLANVHPYDVSFFDLDLSKTMPLTVPDSLFSSGSYEALVRQNIDLFDEVAGNIAYSCTEHRFQRMVSTKIESLTSLGWNLSAALDQMRNGGCRHVAELNVRNFDSNSRGVVEVILHVVNQREEACGIIRTRRTAAFAGASAPSEAVPEKKKSWFSRLFGS